MKSTLSPSDKDYAGNKISLKELVCLPPGCDRQAVKGLLIISIHLKYLNIEREQIDLRCRLWGREGDYIMFSKQQQNQFILQMSIRSSFEILSKYVRDMEILCIECLTTNTKKINQLNRINAITNSHKQAGWIFINFKRYIINHLLNNFEETVSILDMKKQKIGESTVKVLIQPYEEQHLLFDLPKRQNGLMRSFNQNEISQAGEVLFVNRPSKESHDSFPSISPNINGKNSYNSKQIENRTSFEQNINHVIQQQHEKQYYKKGSPDKKGRGYHFLEEYNRNKPDHTQLSLIRQKFGRNQPSVEVMKLKLDEVQLLTNHLPVKSDNVFHNRLNLLLKNLKIEGKTKLQNLIIYCQQSSSKIQTQTIITLPTALNGKYDINYLYILPNYSPFDSLIFQCKDVRAQISIEQLKKATRIQLKNKSIAKRSVIIQYDLISDQSLQKAQQIKNNFNRKEQYNLQQFQNKQSKEQQPKTSLYMNVLNWPQDKILLKNKNIGTVSTSKIIFEVSKDHEPLQIQLQRQNTSKVFLKVDINHIYKEQTYIVDGRQVKIVSAKGSIPEILNLINLNSSIKQKQPNLEAIENKQDKVNEWSMKDLVLIMQALQNCQNQECSELMRLMQSSEEISLKYLQKISQIIKINTSCFRVILQSAFNNEFGLFCQCFHAYHRWNHKYKMIQKKVRRIIDGGVLSSQLRKIFKKLKKNANVIFGIVESRIFMHQFANKQEKMITQNMESQLDKEELNKLIVLILERYVQRSLKLSQLESFLNSKDTILNLNAYLLSKMCQEIMKEPDHYRQYLIDQDWSLLQILKKGGDAQGQWGLAKLIFAAEQQQISSQSSGLQANEKGQTQHLPYVTEEAIHTEQSKKSSYKQFHLDIPKPKMNNQKQEKQPELIAVIFSKLIIPNAEHQILVQLISQKQKICLEDDQLIFPKAISLYKGLIYSVVVKVGHDTYEGTFIASHQSKNVKLFQNEKQIGVLQLFSQQTHTQQSEIPIRIIRTQKAVNLDLTLYEHEMKQQLPSMAPNSAAKSPFIKIIIRSMRPSRVSYNLTLSSNDERVKSIIFPNQIQFLIPNKEEGWQLHIPGQDVNEIELNNHIGSNTYCFCDKNDNKVICTAIIQLQQCWDQNINCLPIQSNQIFVHIDQLIFINQLQPGKYQMILENDDIIKKMHTIQIQRPTKSVFVDLCLSELKSVSKIIVKVIEIKNKKLIAEFKFAIKLIQEGVSRHSRYLIAQQAGIRMLVVVFQIHHNWSYCKPDKILKIFSSEGRKLIQDWLRLTTNPQEQQLIYWLKSNFKLTLGEVDIILNEMLKHSQSQNWKYFLQLFTNPSSGKINNIDDVNQQFLIFDLYQEGMITEQQLKLVKKILNKGFKPVQNLLQSNFRNYEALPQRPQNFIIDLSSMMKPAYFDYLSFIYWIKLSSSEKHAQKFQFENEQQQKQKLKTASNLRIKLTQFVKLSLNGAPCTLLFKIQDHSLAEPIHRCYSHKYCNPIQILVPSHPNPELQIHCKRLNADGKWEYKLIEKIALARQINILGGTIYMEINPCSSQMSQQSINAFKMQPKQIFNHKKQNILPNKKQQYISKLKEEESIAISKPQFSKSFWNRSLNQTKEKWSRSQWPKLGQNKQSLNNYQLNKQELMKKMKKFQQEEWQ